MLLQVEERVPTLNQMKAIFTIASEAATASCENKGAMEAIPTIEEVRNRFFMRQDGAEWPSL